MSSEFEVIGRLPYGQLDEQQRRTLATTAADGDTTILELAAAQDPPNETVIAAIGSIASLQKADTAYAGSLRYARFDAIEQRVAELLEIDEDMQVDNRLRHIYLPCFDKNPDATWVMVGDETGKIYGFGTNADAIDETTFDGLEKEVGEKIHMFGRPTVIG